jgi:hypothetical protein
VSYSVFIVDPEGEFSEAASFSLSRDALRSMRRKVPPGHAKLVFDSAGKWSASFSRLADERYMEVVQAQISAYIRDRANITLAKEPG